MMETSDRFARKANEELEAATILAPTHPMQALGLMVASVRHSLEAACFLEGNEFGHWDEEEDILRFASDDMWSRVQSSEIGKLLASSRALSSAGAHRGDLPIALARDMEKAEDLLRDVTDWMSATRGWTAPNPAIMEAVAMR